MTTNKCTVCAWILTRPADEQAEWVEMAPDRVTYPTASMARAVARRGGDLSVDAIKRHRRHAELDALRAAARP
jgi:hypothetical protein